MIDSLNARQAARPKAGFFAHHGAWAPGIRLFRRLYFREKAWLISTVLLLPALVLGWAFVTQVRAELQFSRLEREGVATMHKLVPLMRAQAHAMAAARAGEGGLDVQSDLERAGREGEAALTALAAHLRSRGDPLQLQAALDRLEQARKAPGTDFTNLRAATSALVQQVADRSNLMLDPEIETLYTILASFVNLPKASEDLALVWGWASFGVAQGALQNPQQYRDFAIRQARAGAAIDDAIAAFARAGDASATIQSRVDTADLRKAAAWADAADVTELVKNASEPSEVWNAGRTAIQATFALYGSALPALDDLLAARVASLEQRLYTRTALVALSLLLGAYLFTCFAKVMRGGLSEVARQLDRMAEGDLSAQPEPWGRDEAADLMRSMGRTRQAVASLVREVQQSTDLIVGASGEIAAGTADLSQRTEAAAAQLQQTAATLEQLTSALGETESRTGRASGLATDNASAADASGTAIAQAVQAMQAIDAASRRINDIIGTIDGIAFQTNILALNAAVEAARAGEHGKGFAVVAAEVRSLAQRSAQAAREVKSLVTDTTEKIAGGSASVEQAGGATEQMIGGVRDIDTLVREIAEATRRQGQEVRDVGRTVTELDHITQQNAALVEQTSAATESLRHQADELATAVSRFRLAVPTAG